MALRVGQHPRNGVGVGQWLSCAGRALQQCSWVMLTLMLLALRCSACVLPGARGLMRIAEALCALHLTSLMWM